MNMYYGATIPGVFHERSKYPYIQVNGQHERHWKNFEREYGIKIRNKLYTCVSEKMEDR